MILQTIGGSEEENGRTETDQEHVATEEHWRSERHRGEWIASDELQIRNEREHGTVEARDRDNIEA